MDRCRCNTQTLFLDAEGDAYTDHLVQEAVDKQGHVTYRCPFTGHRWLGEFVREEGDGQHYELRRTSAGERELRPATGRSPGASGSARDGADKAA
jgi:hypothetical protein